MSGSTTNTQTATPYAPAEPLLKQGLTDALNLYNSGGMSITPYAGDSVADMNQLTLDGINGVSGAAAGMSDAISGAQDIVSGIAGTDMSAVRQGVLADIMPAINSTFAGSGMTGSSLHQQNLAKGLSAGMADAQLAIQGQQLQAAGMVPQMAQAGLQPYQAMINAGNMLQGQEQAETDALIQNDLMTQGADMQAIQALLAMGSGVGGQFGTQTATQRSKPGLFGILGGGLQLASMF